MAGGGILRCALGLRATEFTICCNLLLGFDTLTKALLYAHGQWAPNTLLRSFVW